MHNKQSLLEVKVGGELTLHFLEHRILRGSLSAAGQGLGRRTGECGADTGHVFYPHPKGADQLLDKVQGVGGDGCISHWKERNSPCRTLPFINMTKTPASSRLLDSPVPRFSKATA